MSLTSFTWWRHHRWWSWRWSLAFRCWPHIQDACHSWPGSWWTCRSWWTRDQWWCCQVRMLQRWDRQRVLISGGTFVYIPTATCTSPNGRTNVWRCDSRQGLSFSFSFFFLYTQLLLSMWTSKYNNMNGFEESTGIHSSLTFPLEPRWGSQFLFWVECLNYLMNCHNNWYRPDHDSIRTNWNHFGAPLTSSAIIRSNLEFDQYFSFITKCLQNLHSSGTCLWSNTIKHAWCSSAVCCCATLCCYSSLQRQPANVTYYIWSKLCQIHVKDNETSLSHIRIR